MESRNQRVFGLDIARSVAIWFVLVNHLATLLTNSPVWGTHLNFLGMAGVDLFFALSGYLIGGILIRSVQKRQFHEPHQVGYFLGRRWLRTLPNYWVWFILYACFYSHETLTSGDTLRAFFFLSNLKEFTPVTLGQSWSLMVEEWFYLLFPVLLFFTLKIYKSRAAIAVALTSVPFLVVPLVLKWMMLDPTMSPEEVLLKTYAVTPLRLDSIMFGVLAAAVSARFPMTKVFLTKGVAHVMALGLAVGVYCLAETHKISPVVSFYLFDVIFCLWILALDRPTTTQPATLWSRFIDRTSRWSYSIYLSHTLVWKALDGPLVTSFPSMSFGLRCLLLLAATYMISALSYAAIEQPFLWFRDKWLTLERCAQLRPLPYLYPALGILGIYLLVPTYYNAVSRVAMRANDPSHTRTVVNWSPISLRGKTFQRGIKLDIGSPDQPANSAVVEVQLKRHPVPIDAYLSLRFQAIIPREAKQAGEPKALRPDSDVFLEVYARREGHRRLVTRERLETDDPVSEWHQIAVPLHRVDDKIEVAVIERNPHASVDAPKVAWLAF